MNTIEFPMYRKNGSRVQLCELLDKLPVNGWTWSIVEFEGVGTMPLAMSYTEFQKKLRELQNGFVMTWPEMVQFSKSIEYTIDCLVVAVAEISVLNVNRILLDDFKGCEIVFRAIDSTEWLLSAMDTHLLQALNPFGPWQ